MASDIGSDCVSQTCGNQAIPFLPIEDYQCPVRSLLAASSIVRSSVALRRSANCDGRALSGKGGGQLLFDQLAKSGRDPDQFVDSLSTSLKEDVFAMLCG